MFKNFTGLLLVIILFYGQESFGESLYEQAKKNNERIKSIQNDLNQDVALVNVLSQEEREFRTFILSKMNDTERHMQQEITQGQDELSPILLPPLELSPEEEQQIIASLALIPEAIPQWENVDYYYVGFVGIIAAVYDTFFTKHITKAVKSFRLPVNIQKALEKYSKTPSDIGPGGPGHRGYSPAHDPLLGLIFGIYDLMTGNSTTFINGEIIISPAPNHTLLSFQEAALKWVGHLLSDVFTSRGLPIPGWSILQMLNVGSIGNKGRTVAEIAQGMYNNGYDLRRFAVDGTTPAMIEVLIRTYHYMSLTEQSEIINEADRIVEDERNDAKLASMLFWAHSIATAANAGKITFYAAQPPYIINLKSLTSINIPQWLFFMKSSVDYCNAHLRPMDLEQIRRNRKILNQQWEKMPGNILTIR